MIIKSIEIEIDINDALGKLNQTIEIALHQWGEPLRWAITSIDPVTKIAQVEAIVMSE
jgi:hypothetical protein